MAANDFTDIVNRSLYAGRRSTSNSHAAARGGELVNEAHATIVDSGDPWSFLDREGNFDLTANDDVYDFSVIETGLSLTAGTLRRIRNMVLEDEDTNPLTYRDWGDLENLANSTQDGDPTREPQYYSVLNRTVRFYPMPDEAYSVWARVRVGHSLMDTTDTFLTPDNWTARLIIPYVAARLLQEDGTRDALSLADRYRDQYENDFIAFRNVYAYPDEEVTFRSAGYTEDLDYPYFEYDE